MNKIIKFTCLLFIIAFLLPSGSAKSKDGKNKFCAVIVDSKNQKTLIYNVTYGKGVEKFQDFQGLRGASSVSIPFSKVKSIEVMGKVLSNSDLYSANPYVDTVFHLTDGHTINVQIPAKCVWRGETAFGEISVATEDLKVVTFSHEGIALKCPKCGNIYHLEGFKYCPYDGTKLDEYMEQ